MGRRSDIVSPKDTLRDLVLKNRGAMGLSHILASRQFRYGYSENQIRQYVYQLRVENKGRDRGYGTEAWEIFHKVVIGLEKHVSQKTRRSIQMRRHAKERGVASQTMLDNLAFEGKIKSNGVVHKEEIIRGLEASTKDLRQAAKSSESVREVLEEHEEDFKNDKP